MMSPTMTNVNLIDDWVFSLVFQVGLARQAQAVVVVPVWKHD